MDFFLLEIILYRLKNRLPTVFSRFCSEYAYLFFRLKKWLIRKRFHLNKEFRMETNLFCSHRRVIDKSGIGKVEGALKKCITRNVDYVEE